MLERYPTLKVVGCHLGSLEYDVDELAKRLDRYPNLAVDLAARLVHLQIQPRDKVRAFILKYQDRILYGTDLDFGGGETTGADPAPALARLAATYESDAAWLATDQDVAVESARAGFKSRGVALPGARPAEALLREPRAGGTRDQEDRSSISSTAPTRPSSVSSAGRARTGTSARGAGSPGARCPD